MVPMNNLFHLWKCQPKSTLQNQREWILLSGVPGKNQSSEMQGGGCGGGGRNSNLTCIMPGISFPFKNPCLLHTSKENFLRYRRLNGRRGGGAVRMPRPTWGWRGSKGVLWEPHHSTKAHRQLTLRRKANDSIYHTGGFSSILFSYLSK